MKECILFNAQNECIAFLNVSLMIDLIVALVLLWGVKETIVIILKLMINR